MGGQRWKKGVRNGKAVRLHLLEKRMSHVDIWGKGIQVEETVSAKALRVPGGCQEQGGGV